MLTRWVVSSLVAAGLAGCGNGNSAARPVPAAPAAALGTTGLAGLDWGASSEAVRAAHPGVTPVAGGLTTTGPVEGRDASTTFHLEASGLARVQIDWIQIFPSMTECSAQWSALRARLDARFGRSQSDNLAAYWSTATSQITLECHPDDTGASGMSLSNAPPAP